MAAFEPVPSKVDFPELEAGILDFWREQRVFERAQAQNQEGELFVFHEGPPTANGLPGVHHVL
ncbi:MAG: class I tRNA ligase family protein, partial [Candidatus Dormibacteria bacterium]